MEFEEAYVTYEVQDSRGDWQKLKQVVFDLMPEEFVVEVPREFHKFINGDSGKGIRIRADQCGVAMELPRAWMDCNSILLRGPPSKCAEIKKALLLLVQDLTEREEERKRRAYCETIVVESRHYPVLIGRKGIGLGIHRRNHNVNIQLPRRESGGDVREIAIFGLEHNVKAAKADMVKFLKEFDTITTDKVKIDRTGGVYAIIIGPNGRHVTQIQSRFNVKIQFPKESEIDLVKITGPKEKVERAKVHLLYLARRYTCMRDGN